jgi:hypothetical protein
VRADDVLQAIVEQHTLDAEQTIFHERLAQPNPLVMVFADDKLAEL